MQATETVNGGAIGVGRAGGASGGTGDGGASPGQAFNAGFLDRLLEHEAPPSAAAASVAGPWEVEACADGWAVVALGAGAALGTVGGLRGETVATAVCGERQDALLLAAALPGSAAAGLRLAPRRGTLYGDGRGYELRAEDRPIGSLAWFDTRLVAAFETLRALVASPRGLALLLEAAGHDALERAGRLLASRVAAASPEGESRDG